MYTEYQPSRLLAPYIDNYWEFKGTPEYGMRIHILPDGCTDFIFTLGEAVSKVKEETLVMQPYRSYFVGAMTKYSGACHLCRIRSSVRRSFSALWVIRIYKAAFA